MSYAPIVTIPPSPDYSLRVKIEDHPLEALSKEGIGSRINLYYEKATHWTPGQKKRAWAISLVAISTLGIVSAAFSGLFAASALAFVAVPLGIVGGISIWYLATRGYDLDSPSDRKKAKKEIASWPSYIVLETTFKRFNWIDVVGYALLDGITGEEDLSDKEKGAARAQFYRQFANLAMAYGNINIAYSEVKASIERLFGEATASLRNWRDLQEATLDRREMIGNQAQALATAHRVNAERAGSREGERKHASSLPYAVAGSEASSRSASSTAASGIETAAVILNTGIHIHSEISRNEVRGTFRKNIMPAQAWRSSQLAKLEIAYVQAMLELDLAGKYKEMHNRLLKYSDEAHLSTDSGQKEGVPSTAAASAPAFSAAAPLFAPSAPEMHGGTA